MKSPRLRILSLFGTRPEAIKMAPLVLKMREQSHRFRSIVCVTGQHREMLQQVLKTFGVKPDHDLAIMLPNQTLVGMTARILEGVDRVIAMEKPDLVLVQGDTTTAFVGAVAAFYHHVPVGHVEAGLRTGDFANPFPEELNRALIDRFAALCFAPTQLNRRTLLAEGIPAKRVFVTGNTGIDALMLVRDRVRKQGGEKWNSLWQGASAAVSDHSRKLVLITAHRRESFGERMNAIFGVIRNLACKYPHWHFVYPMHLNPQVRRPALKILTGLHNVHLIEPLPYEPFVFLMDRASMILTDSGGIQEEAPSLGKPVVVMRKTTERKEGVDAGTVILAGNSGGGLEKTVDRLIAAYRPKRNPGRHLNPYGDGRAAEKILEIVWKQLRPT